MWQPGTRGWRALGTRRSIELSAEVGRCADRERERTRPWEPLPGTTVVPTVVPAPYPGCDRRADPLDRSVRAPGQGPADLDHRPLQLPLRVLHAGRGHAVAAPRRAAHLRGDRPDRPGLRRALRVRGHPPHRRRAARAGARHPPRSQLLAPLGVDIALTTNGVKLPEVAHDLARGRAAAHQRVARHACSATLPRARPSATSSNGCSPASTPRSTPASTPVKVNAVVMRGINDDEVVDLARFGREQGVGMRFIEFMPLDAQGEWSNDKVVPARRDPRTHRRGVPARGERGPRTSSPRPATATSTASATSA